MDVTNKCRIDSFLSGLLNMIELDSDQISAKLNSVRFKQVKLEKTRPKSNSVQMKFDFGDTLWG